MRPKDIPPPERFPHGVRARYTSGCRCVECRQANRLYARKRAKHIIFHGKNDLVQADKSRRHLEYLSRHGVGRRAVADASGVSCTVIAEIRSGSKANVRRETERKILAVTRDAHSDHALIPANRTKRQIEELISEGFTKAEIARRLGYKTKALQISAGLITAKTATKIDRFYQAIMAEEAA